MIRHELIQRVQSPTASGSDSHNHDFVGAAHGNCGIQETMHQASPRLVRTGTVFEQRRTNAVKDFGQQETTC